MPVYQAPLKDFAFLLNEYLDISQYADVPGFTEAGELAGPLLDEGAKLCEQVLFPLNQSGDEEGCTYDNGEVRMPKGFKEAYAQYVQGGWASFTCDPEYGGQGLPETLNMPITEMICSANLSFGLTPGLSHGAYNAIYLHASDELKQTYLPKMVTGEWSGVMCLTEPQAGTDLGLLTTKAEPNDDGSYAVSGNKIFISSGEQDLTENIIHLVLARLPDAPKGVKGISLFLVPKMLVNADGSVGERNTLECSGLEHKMGIHASSTCVMNYEGAKGWLVGEPHKGLRAMFTMMNAARIYVGVQGLGLMEVAYQNALQYSNERVQGRALTGPAQPEKPADPITVHPDVRRMLLTQRANVEAARALVMETALKLDLSHKHPDAKVREEADHFVQLVTPIVKAHLTDLGYEMSTMAQQCFGGYGYIKEYGVEQYVRDARIAQIYEGTNGIQAMDLVGRKLSYKYGKYLRSVLHPMQAFIAENQEIPEMKPFVKPLAKHVEYLQQASLWLAKEGLGNPNQAGAGAVEYLRLFSLVMFGYIWAKKAKIATQKLAEGGDVDHKFYQDKLDNATFYITRILPGATSLLLCITAGSKAIMNADLSYES